ncbi:hypothetical protein Mal64_05170 [Pseudobythopirellula maris]|uniref:Transmembrane protein n=1 Tax=Pseudobythopirellula maris TaxID=2527991 RepID=A0A5C5ZRK2_9BACT|nr:hypothetical protein [Pseudobythopirellula maris]TWT90134.1 hypothetical protein Mal64_05170 [Pseudobythopirellula maris]
MNADSKQPVDTTSVDSQNLVGVSPGEASFAARATSPDTAQPQTVAGAQAVKKRHHDAKVESDSHKQNEETLEVEAMRMESELAEEEHRPGMVAVYADRPEADVASRRVRLDRVAANDVVVINDPDSLTAKMLAPTEPQPSRNRSIMQGVIVGACLGALAGLGLHQGYEASYGSAMFALCVGAVLGVLAGSTVTGLFMPPYRDDTLRNLRWHLRRGHALLVATGDEKQLERARGIISKTQPLEVLNPSGTGSSVSRA